MLNFIHKENGTNYEVQESNVALLSRNYGIGTFLGAAQ